MVETTYQNREIGDGLWHCFTSFVLFSIYNFFRNPYWAQQISPFFLAAELASSCSLRLVNQRIPREERWGLAENRDGLAPTNIVMAIGCSLLFMVLFTIIKLSMVFLGRTMA